MLAFRVQVSVLILLSEMLFGHLTSNFAILSTENSKWWAFMNLNLLSVSLRRW